MVAAIEEQLVAAPVANGVTQTALISVTICGSIAYCCSDEESPHETVELLCLYHTICKNTPVTKT